MRVCALPVVDAFYEVQLRRVRQGLCQRRWCYVCWRGFAKKFARRTGDGFKSVFDLGPSGNTSPRRKTSVDWNAMGRCNAAPYGSLSLEYLAKQDIFGVFVDWRGFIF